MKIKNFALIIFCSIEKMIVCPVSYYKGWKNARTVYSIDLTYYHQFFWIEYNFLSIYHKFYPNIYRDT